MMLAILYKNKTVWSHAGSMGSMAVLFVMAVQLVAPVAMAGAPVGQRTYATPQEAVKALICAVRDDKDSELAAILGPDSLDIISSGDRVADKNGRERFLRIYEEKNSLRPEGYGKMVLYIGSKGYPFPIPIVQQGTIWFFDTKAGKEEILCRRIGRNELHTIEVLHAYTVAQREYAAIDHNGDGVPEFARRLISSEGKKDGLYWKAKKGEEESPFGPLIAKATQAGYAGRLNNNDSEPFYGYYFKILTSQGAHADGGVFDYVVNGKMILGFALVAYPAKYGSSGIMTFIVNQAGVIYEKDLGENTSGAAAMTLYDPDKTWKKYKEAPGQ